MMSRLYVDHPGWPDEQANSCQKVPMTFGKLEFHRCTGRAKVIVALCALLLFHLDCLAVADKGGPRIGDVPPPLVVTKTIQGPPATEISWDKLRGKVVVLEFWATWCGPCLKAIPHMNSLVKEFQDKPVVFLSVTAENEDIVRLFLKTRPIAASVALDDYEVLNKAFHVQGIPHVVIVSREGRIAAIADPSQIEAQHLEEVLAGNKCSLPELEVGAVSATSTEVVSSSTPPLFEVSIREHKIPKEFQGPICMWSGVTNGVGFNGKIATVETALNIVLDINPRRIYRDCKFPEGYYDFTLQAPAGRRDELLTAFEGALRTTFRLDVRRTNRIVDAYILTQIRTNVPGLRRVEKPGGGGGMLGGFRYTGTALPVILDDLETALGRPVFDETGLSGWFAVDMKWTLSEAERLRMLDRRIRQAAQGNPQGDWISSLPKELREGKALEDDRRLQTELAKPEPQQFLADFEAVNNAARTRLGLQLTPVRRTVEVLEVSPIHTE
jgi:uncharacterized protein (TIGR03435 family)